MTLAGHAAANLLLAVSEASLGAFSKLNRFAVDVASGFRPRIVTNSPVMGGTVPAGCEKGHSAEGLVRYRNTAAAQFPSCARPVAGRASSRVLPATYLRALGEATRNGPLRNGLHADRTASARDGVASPGSRRRGKQTRRSWSAPMMFRPTDQGRVKQRINVLTSAGVANGPRSNFFLARPCAVKGNGCFGKGGRCQVLFVTSLNLGPVGASASAGPLLLED